MATMTELRELTRELPTSQITNAGAVQDQNGKRDRTTVVESSIAERHAYTSAGSAVATGSLLTNDPPEATLAPMRAAVIMLVVAGITFLSSMTTGLLATGLPKITKDVGFSDALALWPASIYGLTGGCTFIPVGSVADVVGSRPVHLLGCLFLGVCVLAAGLSRTAWQLILARGLQGVAASCCLPTAISILTETFPPGRLRTRGLALQGAAQPVGFSAGLFLGGVFADTLGWRSAWFITAGLSVPIFAAGLWAIPAGTARAAEAGVLRRIAKQIDWVGALLTSLCLGSMSYVLATTASRRSNIDQPANIALLCLAGLMIPAFILWMRRQERAGKPALIPNSVWQNVPFTTICAMLFLVSAVLNAGEYFFSLFFQKVQHLSSLQASLRYLPNIIVGVVISFATDATLHRWSTYRYVMAMSSISALAPLLMALMQPRWSYWEMAFWAMLFLPFANDVLFIVGALLITSSFPPSRQALAGSILSTVYQFGSAVGLAVMSVIAAVATEDAASSSSSSVSKGSLTKGHGTTNHDDDDVLAGPLLLVGYRAAFWACLACSIVFCAVGAWGLRGIGMVGVKRD